MTGVLIGLLSVVSWADEPRWLEDYGQARALARQTGKPMFVVFRCRH
jgi:hypothetical protein